jgi:hypothetical protein
MELGKSGRHFAKDLVDCVVVAIDGLGDVEDEA